MNDHADKERHLLIEQACGAWRPRDRDGRVAGHPAWYDISEQDQAAVYAATGVLRRMEAALDPDALTTTARAVLNDLP